MDEILSQLSDYPEWLQRSEIAYTLGVTDSTVKRWVKLGKVQQRKIGRIVEVNVADVIRYRFPRP
jgi:DNA-binding transcriptional regulator LsrR (DeoR family)